jgi:hypothetical protein
MPQIGHRRWAIAEGYIPGQSLSQEHALVSHEAICLLNAGDTDAAIEITLYFKDRDPVGPYAVRVGARRTLHLRLNDLDNPAPVPRDTEFSSVIKSSVPIVVQHTRLDSRHPNISLMSTVAYFEG